MFNKRTDELEAILKGKDMHQTEVFMQDNASEFLDDANPFAVYMRRLFKEHQVKQQDVFLKADFPQRFGYRLISGERRTRQRDYILRLCLAACFSLEETQRALQIYGMSRLYIRVPRDEVLMFAFENEIREISEVNALLESKGMLPLKLSPIDA